MNEVEKKELKKLENKIASVHPFYVETIAEALVTAGYGKVDDYKKEIFALKTTLEDREYEVRELNKKVERLKDENNNLKSEKEGYKSRLKDSGKRNKKLSLKLGKLKKEKQQAIKEFAEKLRSTLIINNEGNTEIFDYDFTLETINDLLKEYGIGETK